MFNRDKKIQHKKVSLSMNRNAVVVMLLGLMVIVITVMPVAMVVGQSPTGFNILQITKFGEFQSISSGTVGEAITVTSTLNTYSGPYRLWFNDIPIDNGTSQGYLITSNITIPEVPKGNYNFTLLDETLNANVTYSFEITSLYSAVPLNLPASPAQFQEGNPVTLNITVLGGDASTAYAVNITVELPQPLPSGVANFSRLVSLTTSNKGTAILQIPFPDSGFQPADSTTIFSGTYNIYFNATENLSKSSFFVGITDLSSYHRGETVKIRAVGYQVNQAATLKIALQNGASVTSQSVTADGQGIITSSWTVPSNVVLGQYNVTITTAGNPKAIPDSQIFTIPGYAVEFTAVNLAGETVPGILVETTDQNTKVVYNGTTNYAGIATINLESGNQTVDAYWNDVNVGEIKATVTGNSSFTVSCKLTDIQLIVQDKNGVAIPFVDLNIGYQYTTTKNSTIQNGNVSVQTDLSGKYVLNSTLPKIGYIINASKYNTVFNVGNNTINNLPEQPRSSATILCPDESLRITTLDYTSAALPNARLVLIEQSSGVFYAATTDGSGNANLQVTFGQYRVSVFSADNILLNETVVKVLSSTQTSVRCDIYNLHVSVKVVDYFGNSIPNAKVEFSREGTNTQLATTASDGTYTFNNVIGGSIEIKAFPASNPAAFVATSLQLEAPTTIQIQLGKYVALGGLLVEGSMLATLILIFVAVVLFLSAEIVRRKFFSKKKQKTEN